MPPAPPLPFDIDSPAARREAAQYAEIFACAPGDVLMCLLRARGDRAVALRDLRDRLTARPRARNL
jgi:hypothetical protein